MKTMMTILFCLFYISLFAPDYNITEHNERKQEYNDVLIQYRIEQQVQRILSALRIIESGNNYSVIGLSNEKGGYQFLTSTWKYWCNKTVGYQLDITNPEHQDIIAREKVKCLIYEQGYSLDQLASFWNCGSPNYKGKKGVNRYGVNYNVHEYVEKFLNTYNSLI
jgi:hypothetical protein